MNNCEHHRLYILAVCNTEEPNCEKEKKKEKN